MITSLSRWLRVPPCCAALLFLPLAGARADSISFTDQWKDFPQSIGGSLKVVSQDTGSFNISLTIPGLANLSTTDLAHLQFTASFGDISLPGDFTNSGAVSLNSITSTQTELDDSGHAITVGTVSISRNQNVAIITGKVQNPVTAKPFPIFADRFLGTSGAIRNQKNFSISLGGPLTYSLRKNIYITGTGSISQDSQGDNVNTVQISGAANFTPPALSLVSPAKNARVTTPNLTVQARAADAGTVTDVEFSLNGGNFQPGTAGASNYWSANLVLSAGTNTINVFAMDADGYVSATNKLTVQYVVLAPMTVIINGPGKVSPDYNGQSLQVQATYSMAAKADTGSSFVNWTAGSGTDSSATLKFVMQSNLVLTANFKDTMRPTMAITSPKSGSRSSNSVVTVSGTAKDNADVSNVWFSVNSGAWMMASGSNNWSAQVNLTPGTNIISAYAIDTSGNLSLSNTIKLNYILSALLSVQTAGSGNVTPNYDNALLAIGINYTMKATAAKGFAFYYWSGGVPMSSSPTLTFSMVPGLAIIANFKDITPPTITITSPKSGEKYSNDVIQVTGSASDNAGVTAVGVQINNGGWTNANAATRWNLNLPVARGTNIVQAYAMDDAGNVSTTNTVKFVGVFPPGWAPDSLAGLTLQTSTDGGFNLLLDFTNYSNVSSATNLASQTDFATNGDSGFGNYLYFKNSANLADLVVQPSPFYRSLNEQDIQLIFTNFNTGIFVYSNDPARNGVFTLATAEDLVPASWSGHTFTATNAAAADITTISFKGNDVTLVFSDSSNKVSGTFRLLPGTSISSWIEIDYSGTTPSYLQLTFTSKTSGHYEFTNFDNTGAPILSSGNFTWQ